MNRSRTLLPYTQERLDPVRTPRGVEIPMQAGRNHAGVAGVEHFVQLVP